MRTYAGQCLLLATILLSLEFKNFLKPELSELRIIRAKLQVSEFDGKRRFRHFPWAWCFSVFVRMWSVVAFNTVILSLVHANFEWSSLEDVDQIVSTDDGDTLEQFSESHVRFGIRLNK